MHTCMKPWGGQRSQLGISLNCSPLIACFSRQGLSLNTDFINLASPASQQVPGYSSLLSPLAMLGIQIQQTPAVGLGAPSSGLHVCTADN